MPNLPDYEDLLKGLKKFPSFVEGGTPLPFASLQAKNCLHCANSC